jgi:hypothetical protein
MNIKQLNSVAVINWSHTLIRELWEANIPYKKVVQYSVPSTIDSYYLAVDRKDYADLHWNNANLGNTYFINQELMAYRDLNYEYKLAQVNGNDKHKNGEYFKDLGNGAVYRMEKV